MKITTSDRNGQEIKVKVEEDKYGIMLLTTRNGYQWSGCSVKDAEMASMIIEVLQQHFNISTKGE